MITPNYGFRAAANRVPFGFGQSDWSRFHDVNHGQMAKRIGPLDGIEEEHEANQRPVDRCRSIAFGEQVVSIGFGIRRRDLGGFESRVFLLFTLCTTLPLPPKNVNEIPYPFVSTSIDGVRRARSSCLSCEHRVAWLINILKTRGVDGQNGG